MKILFVGNSHTYMNDMPEMVRINSKEELEVTMIARPAITFHDHIESMELQFALKQDFDIVVFQQAAHYPCPSKEETLKDAKYLIELARSCGVMPYIMIPWAQKNEDKDFEVIKNIYHQVMLDNFVDGIPIGYIINDLNHNYAEIDLFQEDHQHLSVLGSYVQSIAILNTLFLQTDFKGCISVQSDTCFKHQTLALKLNKMLVTKVIEDVTRFKKNYCVCGKRELLDD